MSKKTFYFGLLLTVGLISGCARQAKNDFPEAALEERECKLMIAGPMSAFEQEQKMILAPAVLKDVLKKLHLIDLWNQESQTPFTEATALEALSDSIELKHIDGTQIINIRVTRPEAFEASEIANEIAHAYVANRLLLLGKASEGQLQEMEQKIAAQKLIIEDLQQQAEALKGGDPNAIKSAWLDEVAEAKLAADQASEKRRFVESIPFEEWPYYTNFNWGETYEEAIKDLMNANVSLEYLSRSLGTEHPRMAEAIKTRDALRERLTPIVVQIKQQVIQDAAETQATLAALRKAGGEPPPLTAAQTKSLNELTAKMATAEGAYRELVAQANALESEQEKDAVKVTVVELARP